jgi:predicted ATPase
MAAVKNLTIAGYKSIRDLRDFELRNLNVLIGANGAGKSNFIDLFRMLPEIVAQRFQRFIQDEGGPDALLHFSRKTTEEICVELSFGDRGYSFVLLPNGDSGLIFEDERLWAAAPPLPGTLFADTEHVLGIGHLESRLKESTDSPMSDVWKTVEEWRIYHFHETGAMARLRQRHASFDTRSLKVDGENLAAYLNMLRYEHPGNYRMILYAIRLVAPFFDDFVAPTVMDSEVELRWTEKGRPDTVLGPHALSDGTLRFMCLCTLLLQPWRLMPATIIIDEPELGLHRHAIATLSDLLRRAAERRQLIISTQSVELLNCMEPEDVVVVDRKDDASTFNRLDSAELADWLKEASLGELWQQNVLGGRPV